MFNCNYQSYGDYCNLKYCNCRKEFKTVKMKTAKEYLLDRYFPTLPQDEKELWYKTCDWAPVIVQIMSEYGVDCQHAIWNNKPIICRSNIDWDEVYRNYKEWYMTDPRSWQEAINVFKWMKEQIIEQEKE